MGPGGKICYCGPPSEMNEYFGKQDLVEIYNELAVNTDNWNGYYLQNYWQKRQEEPALTKAEDMFIKNSARRSVSWFKQLRVLTARYMNLIKNDYSRLLLLLVQPVAIALLLFLVAQEGSFVNFDDTKSILPFPVPAYGLDCLTRFRKCVRREPFSKESIWEICGCPAMCCPNTLFRELFVLYRRRF